eukprot:1139903-Pelagomonas_calceolata.AAC.5
MPMSLSRFTLSLASGRRLSLRPSTPTTPSPSTPTHTDEAPASETRPCELLLLLLLLPPSMLLCLDPSLSSPVLLALLLALPCPVDPSTLALWAATSESATSQGTWSAPPLWPWPCVPCAATCDCTQSCFPTATTLPSKRARTPAPGSVVASWTACRSSSRPRDKEEVLGGKRTEQRGKGIGG